MEMNFILKTKWWSNFNEDLYKRYLIRKLKEEEDRYIKTKK